MDRFMQTHYPSFYRTFKSYKYLIQQIDAFLYHYGGIYLDLDIGTKRPMDRYLNHDLVLVKSMNVSSSYTNALMMVSVRNPFMKQCMSALELHSHSYEHLHVKATNIYMYICFSCVYAIPTNGFRHQSGSVLVRIVHRGPRKKLVWRDDSHIPKKTRWTN